MSEDITNVKINMAKLEAKLSSTDATVNRIEKKLDDFIECTDEKFVTNERFRPVKNIVYGMVGFILLAFLSGVVGMVILK